jgi:hypothetical protein
LKTLLTERRKGEFKREMAENGDRRRREENEEV